jgi:hypothetical protein
MVLCWRVISGVRYQLQCSLASGNVVCCLVPRLVIPAGILRIPVFSVPVALFSQESRFLFRRNFFGTPSGILSVGAYVG